MQNNNSPQNWFEKFNEAFGNDPAAEESIKQPRVFLAENVQSSKPDKDQTKEHKIDEDSSKEQPLQREVFSIIGCRGLFLPGRNKEPAYRILGNLAATGEEVVESGLTLEQLIERHSEAINRLRKVDGLPELDPAEMKGTVRCVMDLSTSLYRTFKKMEAEGTTMASYVATVNSLIENGYDDDLSLASMFIIQYGAPADQAVARKQLAKIAIVDENLEELHEFALGGDFSTTSDFPRLVQNILKKVKSEFLNARSLNERFYFLTASGRVLTMPAPQLHNRDRMAEWLKYFIKERQFVGVIHVMEVWNIMLKDSGERAYMVKNGKKKVTDPNKQVIGEALHVLTQARDGFIYNSMTLIKRNKKGKPSLRQTIVNHDVHGRFTGLFNAV